MNKTRKIISLILVFILVFGCATVIPASAAETSGKTGEVLPARDTMEFRNTLGWGEVFMYSWSGDYNSSVDWPGKKLSPSGIDEYGCEVYCIDIPFDADGIVLNNGAGQQTADITDFYPEGGGYYLDADRTTDNGYGQEVYVPIPLDEPAGAYYIIGDADGNKTVNISDVTAVQKYLADVAVPENFDSFAADADQNNVINIDDATLIQLYLAGIERKNNSCGTGKTTDPYDDSICHMAFYDVIGWGDVSLIARDKNGNRLPAKLTDDDFYDKMAYLPNNTASLVIVSEDGTKRTVPCTDTWFLRDYFGTIYVSYDKSNSRYVVNYDLWDIGGLYPEICFVNSLGWDKVVMEGWDEYGNMVESHEVERSNNGYIVSPAFYTRKITFSDGNGHRTDYITQYYCVPGEPDIYCPDEEKTTVNDMGETVCVLKHYAYNEYSAVSFMFENSLKWENVYVYAWFEDGNQDAEWPGVKLTDCKINDYGQQIYTVNVPNHAAGVILTDGEGHQTDNITDYSPACYYLDSENLIENEFGATVYVPIPYIRLIKF